MGKIEPDFLAIMGAFLIVFGIWNLCHIGADNPALAILASLSLAIGIVQTGNWLKGQP